MRICRYDDNRVGLVRGNQVFDATAALDELPSFRWPLPSGDLLIANLERLRPRLEEAAARSAPRAIEEVRLLSPVANPTKIVAAPVNYKLHLDEVLESAAIHHGQQIKTIHTAGVFLKATSSLVGAGEGVAVRFLDERRTDHEVELAVVIGRKADRVTREQAKDYIAGYAIGLDITVRGPEERSLRKSLDSHSVLGPWLVTADEIEDPNALDFDIQVNGETRQRSNTRLLIFDVYKLIELASSFYTLHPGDIIMTGTPEGVGPIQPGDRMVASLQGVGTMSVLVRAA